MRYIGGRPQPAASEIRICVDRGSEEETENRTHRQDDGEDDLDDVAAGWAECQLRFIADAKQVGGKAC
jgi:hypothetical protein